MRHASSLSHPRCSVGRDVDSSRGDHEGGLAGRHHRVLLNPRDALVALALAEGDARVGDVCDNVAADRLLRVLHKGGRGSWVGGDLVGDDDGKVEDLCKVLHLREDLAHPLLPLGELPAAGELLLGERERGA